MLQGYIYMPEEDFLHLHRDLKRFRIVSLVFAGICGTLCYLVWKGNEKTEEKAG